jgi:DNA modification methylase
MNAMQTHHKIITGDSRHMAEVSNESVHLVVTSPPYWQLKDYGNGRQIGFDDEQEMRATSSTRVEVRTDE